MSKAAEVIEVRIWGRTVGAVARDPALGFYAFEYDPAFVPSGIELAPLTMPLAAAREPFAFPLLPDLTYMRLPGMLADALPDDFGNALIDAWMADNGVAKPAITSLDRLAYMGKRGVGALEFKPVRGPAEPKSSALHVPQLVESLLDRDHLAKAALAPIIQVGTSAGGARAKAVVAWNPSTNEIRAGQFDVTAGFEHWLLKFDGMGSDRELGEGQDYGRIEYAYHLMAAASGIAMSPARLLEENGRAHFMTKRFDRDGNTKHHLQTFCAMAHVDYRQKATHDASQLFLTIAQLGLGYPAMEEAFRRIAFNVMAANRDDHTKNVSFLLRGGGSWELAPAYDVTHAHNPKGDWTDQHLLAVNGKFSGIKRDDLLAVADRFGIGTAPQLLKHVSAAVAAWRDHAAQAKVRSADIEWIRGHHRLV